MMKKKTSKMKSSILSRLILVVFVIYAVFTLIKIQVDINKQVAENKKAANEISQVKTKKEAVEKEIANASSDEYIKQQARKEGMAEPGERIFVDASSN